MGQIVVNVGSFDLTSHNGKTAYGTTKYFDIPANNGITSCVATFATHTNAGSFLDKAFSLNGARAHSNSSWPTSGIALNAALLATGQNTFRVTINSQAVSRWSIGTVYLTITYNDVDDGGGEETKDPGTLSISKTSLAAGESLTVSITGSSSGVYRDVYIQKMPSEANILYVKQGQGSGAGSWTVTIPVSWCETLSPNDPSFEVRIYMVAYVAGGRIVGSGAKMLTVNVPASAVPTIGTFTATRNANGVDASITNYVQNYSKVALAIGGELGALGSSITSYEITGAGFSAATKTTTFGPFSQTGNITFTAKVTDTRGRTATKTVTINMLAYARISGQSISAYRSNGLSVADDEGAYVSANGTPVFSSLDGQNAATIKGRVYEKGTTPGSWVSMTSGAIKLFGGSYSVEKGYTAEISINDKITSTVYTIQIPTATVGIHIMPGVTGMGLGEYGESGKLKVAWPIYSQGEKVALASYPVGAVFLSIVNTSPATLFGGTWSALATGKFLRTGTGGSTGGSDTHVHSTAAVALTVAQIPSHTHAIWSRNWAINAGTGGGRGNEYGSKGEESGSAGSGATHGHGNTGSSSNVPAYYEVYAWRRTA